MFVFLELFNNFFVLLELERKLFLKIYGKFFVFGVTEIIYGEDNNSDKVFVIFLSCYKFNSFDFVIFVLLIMF